MDLLVEPQALRPGRTWPFALLLPVALAAGWWSAGNQPAGNQQDPVVDRIAVYYTELDASTEATRSAALGPAHDSRSVTFFAATQAVAGPPSDVDAVRFPDGTHVRSVTLNESMVTVDLSKDVERLAGGSDREEAAFKSLVWTLTALPGIDAVSIRIDGARIAAIPGGHFELDEPLKRSDW
jgi:spore germination protein GerM